MLRCGNSIPSSLSKETSKAVISVWTKTADKTDEQTRADFEQRMRDSYRQVYSLALRLSGNTQEAEDIVQEAYVRAFRFFHRFDTSLSFTSWMFRILSNVHIDSARKRSKFKTCSLDRPNNLSDSAWDIADASGSPDKMIEEHQLEDTVQLGLMSMSAEFRTAVLLADVEGLAYEEIAEIMKTSIGTVRSRIHRGRIQLRQYLEQAAPERYCVGGPR
jgi:RNA polymerase sigma-70 factor (ECF subfamily)